MPFYDEDINQIIKDDFLEYAGHVMQERSVPDARDGLKDGARKILYIQYKDKNIHSKNFIKGAAAVGQAMKMGYLHGDASAYGTLVRMGKHYAYPYTLEELQGNVGNQVSPDNHASMRYLELRQSELASYLFNGIEKNAIVEWYDNYANTMQLPRVLPTIGFYPIVNGLQGIAVGLSTSWPSTNLREVNNAIIKLITNPDATDDDIYCAPDFPMGGIITNGAEVRQSMLAGTGKAVKTRAKIEFVPDKNMLVATEIPFSVYTDTIDNELMELINTESSCGIARYIDATNDNGARINIYLEKGANVNKVINLLYKATSLESYYSINLIMLEEGRFPRMYTWRDALQTYINHIRICKRREVQFDLDKALARKNIIDGLIKACSIIDEVIAIIRKSENRSAAAVSLIHEFGFNGAQADAILEIKLSRLTKLDIVELKAEWEKIIQQIEWCNYLLNDATALDNELIKILTEVANKFGDERRTKVIDLIEQEEEIKIEEKDVTIMLFDNNTIRVIEKEEQQSGKRGRKGANLKPPKNATLINTIYSTNLSSLMAFTSSGKVYPISISNLDIGTDVSIYSLINLNQDEQVELIVDSSSFDYYQYLVTVSKKGYVKKTAIDEYITRQKKGIVGVKLADNDYLVNVFLANNTDKLMIFSTDGKYNYYAVEKINSTGRATRGSKGIDADAVSCAVIVRDNISYYGLLTISSDGRGKISPLADYTQTSRGVKGNKAMELKNDNFSMAYLVPQDKDKITILAGTHQLTLNINEIPVQARSTLGVNLINTTSDIIAII